MASNYKDMCFTIKKSIIQNQKTFIPVPPLPLPPMLLFIFLIVLC